MAITVAVIEEHTLTRYGLARLIEEQPDMAFAGEACSGAEALRLVATQRPTVVTLAVSLPDIDGMRLARGLRDRYPDLGIVVLTSRDEDDVLFRAMETGASAFVPKTAPTAEVLGAVRHAAVAASSFTATGLIGAFARRQARSMLSPRERETLQLLSRGLSVPAIAELMHVTQSTAKTYVTRLYDKLGASNRAQALMTAVQHGLIRTMAS
ncbi:response regulator transcription factor [Kutzneria kofuensis]|uniref:DNA-binding NarL/FixJ family response regulator n=1 Tax=Kutzneria kofuensis TaxID=103725 RepID=A0A7W9NME9_9PSEU|nr:response regulator transcription factor [Kutzneria kofuensis]MBB5897456.1 DNA-binding NarL/FixJ family response regulator [Kutzneria kofuensis]